MSWHGQVLQLQLQLHAIQLALTLELVLGVDLCEAVRGEDDLPNGGAHGGIVRVQGLRVQDLGDTTQGGVVRALVVR